MRYTEILEACWKGYRQAGMKKKGDRRVPNCVPVSEQQMEEDLKKWFREKWVRFGPDGKIRGACARGSSSEGKPKCLPQAKAHALGKKGRANAAAKKRREDPDPERRGPAKNVATKVKEEHQTMWRVIYRGEVKGVYDTMQKAADIAKRLQEKYGVQARVEQTVAPVKETMTDYQKRRQRERDVDMGKPVRPLPKNPQTDWAKKREKEKQEIDEKQDACYRKVKSRYKVWPSAYASGALVQCRKKGAANWGNKGKKK